MSLKVKDHRSGRSRSKSPGVQGRSRSRSDVVRVPSPPHGASIVDGKYDMQHPFPHHAHSATYSMPHPPGGANWHNHHDDDSDSDSDSDKGDEVVMDWNDLPPEERPGYVPPGGHQPSEPPYAQAKHAEVKYAPALTPKFSQTNYKTPDPLTRKKSNPLQRKYSESPPREFGFGQGIGTVNYTAKPVTHHSSISEGSHGHGYNVSPFHASTPDLASPLPHGFPPHHGSLPYPGAQMPGGHMPAMPNHFDYANIEERTPDGKKKKKDKKDKKSHHEHSIPSPPLPPPLGPFGSHGHHNEHSILPPPLPPLGMHGHHNGPAIPPPPPVGLHGLHHGPAIPPPPPVGLHGHHLSVGGMPGFDRAPSPGLTPHMDRLSVHGNGAHVRTVAPGHAPPASPLLEAYQGTYQSMPSPFIMARHHDDDLDDLPPLSHFESSRSKRSTRHKRSSSSSSSASEKKKDKKSSRKHRPSISKKSSHSKSKSITHTDEKIATTVTSSTKRRVTMYDAEKDAKTIAEGLAHTRPDTQPLIDILPTLSHDQLMELRSAYKKVCKIQGRGINIAKHIKLKTSGTLGKLMYVLALGRYESEGYWTNTWYQSNSSRRELLIEALMGRSNQDIKLIKANFQDKRYGDSLTRCMDKELKADKFRAAVLMALEERRQDEGDVWPLEYRDRDVDGLYEALRRREGGETAILQIVVTRSDAHLRLVLREYEKRHGSNFAKEALKKSNNLVGEVIAHILNGVINRPARDALLLRHALTDLSTDEGSKGQDRHELLISRLVRMHWEPKEWEETKEEYYEKYGKDVEDDIERYVRSEDVRDACLNLCSVR